MQESGRGRGSCEHGSVLLGLWEAVGGDEMFQLPGYGPDRIQQLLAGGG